MDWKDAAIVIGALSPLLLAAGTGLKWMIELILKEAHLAIAAKNTELDQQDARINACEGDRDRCRDELRDARARAQGAPS